MLARDDAEFGVNLVLGQAVDHMAAGVLEELGIVDVVLLVKAGAQLQQAQHVLAPVGRVGQCGGNLAAGGHAVKRDLDGENFRIVGSFVDQVHKGHHALERVAEEQIVLFNVPEVLPFLQAHIADGLPLGITEAGGSGDAGTKTEVEGGYRVEDAALRNTELLDQRCTGGVGQLAVDLDADRLLALAA